MKQNLLNPFLLRKLTLYLLAAIALSLFLVLPINAQAATCNGVPATIVATTPGQITGTAGVDVIIGTTGDDSISGLAGDDIICAGAGNDTIIWNPGDGSDVVEGQAGTDTLQFAGSAANEQINLSAVGTRLRLLRDVANVTIDGADLEQISLFTLGGTDTITINSLSGTSVNNIALSLAVALGGGIGDALADTVIVNGTTNDDTITIIGSTGNATIMGLGATISIDKIENSLDRLIINSLAGNDTVSANRLTTAFAQFLSLVIAPGILATTSATVTTNPLIRDAASINNVVKLTLNGGPGNDVLTGSQGDDTFIWNPGDGSDSIEGQAGNDMMLFNGSNIGENIDLSANGARVRFFRNVANIMLDMNDLEDVTFRALGGADIMTIGDLSGTDVTKVNLDLDSSLGAGTGDGQADSVIVNGTSGDDAIIINGSASSLAVAGLHTAINLSSAEGASDKLTLNSLAGSDTVDASGLAAGVVSLTIDGADGADVLIGSAGADTIFGGANDDVLIGGPGIDILDGGSGNNVIIQ